MDDLLLFPRSKKPYIAKLEDLLKALLKKWTWDLTKGMPII